MDEFGFDILTLFYDVYDEQMDLIIHSILKASQIEDYLDDLKYLYMENDIMTKVDKKINYMREHAVQQRV